MRLFLRPSVGDISVYAETTLRMRSARCLESNASVTSAATGSRIFGITHGLGITLFCAALALCITPGIAQTHSQTTTASSAPDFPAPTLTGTLGFQAPAAIAEIAAHLQAASITGWKDLQATGTLSYPASDSHSAVLYLSGSGKARLDITMDAGIRSVRLADHIGSYVDEKGHQESLLSETSSVGIVALARVWTAAAESQQLSVKEQGSFTASGQDLHRITVEYPLVPSAYKPGGPTVATDLYFDRQTHQLLYSVDSVKFFNFPGQLFTRVTSYADYRKLSGILVPTTIRQAISGQPLWTLTLNQLTINSQLAANDFSF